MVASNRVQENCNLTRYGPAKITSGGVSAEGATSRRKHEHELHYAAAIVALHFPHRIHHGSYALRPRDQMIRNSVSSL